MYLLVFIALIWVMIRYGMWRTVVFIGVSMMSGAIIALGFFLSLILTFMFTPEVVQAMKHLPVPSWTNDWINMHQNMGPMLLVPVIFIADVFRWIFLVTFFHGGVIIWVVMAISSYFAVMAYLNWFGFAFDFSNDPPAPAKKQRVNGYDENGYFIGYDYDPLVGNIQYDSKGNRIN